MNEMTLPVRPPIRPNALPTLFAAPLSAGPADEVTLERPSDAFDVVAEAALLTFEAPADAASVTWEVVELGRAGARRANRCDCRIRIRGAEENIGSDRCVARGLREKEMKLVGKVKVGCFWCRSKFDHHRRVAWLSFAVDRTTVETSSRICYNGYSALASFNCQFYLPRYLAR